MAVLLLGQAEDVVVLDDPVVDQGAAIPADVGVGVALRWLAVGGPAGVRDAEITGEGMSVEFLRQALHLA